MNFWNSPILQTMKLPVRLSAGALLAALSLASCFAAAESSPVTVTVDPRVELVALTQHLGGYAQRFKGRINDFDHPYLNALRAHFAGFTEHESIKRLAALGIGGSDPTGIAVQLSWPNEVAFPGPVDRSSVRTDRAVEYAEQLRTFARAADFAAFFAAHQADHEALIADFARTVEPQVVADRVERYCGLRASRYIIVLAPLLGRTSFGPRVAAPDGTETAYAILPAQGVVDGRLSFSDPAVLADGICHEFGHSFINPLVARHWAEFAPLEVLMDRVRYAPSMNYGRDWRNCVNEHLVRAMTARIVRQQKGEAAYTALLAREKGRGFAFIEELCAALATFERRRDTYPNLDQFLPELVRVLAQLAAPPASTVGR